jgi:hypothetical protein
MAGKKDTTSTLGVNIKGTEELARLAAALEQVSSAANKAGSNADAAIAQMQAAAATAQRMANTMSSAAGRSTRVTTSFKQRVGPAPGPGQDDTRPEFAATLSTRGRTPAEEAAVRARAAAASYGQKTQAIGAASGVQALTASDVRMSSRDIQAAKALLEKHPSWYTKEDIGQAKFLAAKYKDAVTQSAQAARDAEKAVKQEASQEKAKFRRRARGWTLRHQLEKVQSSEVPLSKGEQAQVRELLETHPSWWSEEDLSAGKVIAAKYGPQARESLSDARAASRKAASDAAAAKRKSDAAAAADKKRREAQAAAAVKGMPAQALREGRAESQAEALGRKFDDLRGHMSPAEYAETMQRFADYRDYVDRGDVVPARKILQDIDADLKKVSHTAKSRDESESVRTRIEQTRLRAQGHLRNVEKFSPADVEKAQELVKEAAELSLNADEQGLQYAKDKEKSIARQLKLEEQRTKEVVTQGRQQENEQKQQERAEKGRFARMGKVYAASRFVSSLGSLGTSAISGGAQGFGSAFIGVGGALGTGLQNLSASSIINKGLGFGNAFGFGLGALASIAASGFSALHERGKAVIARADASRQATSGIVGSMLAAGGVSPLQMLMRTGGADIVGELGTSDVLGVLEQTGFKADIGLSEADVLRVASHAVKDNTTFSKKATLLRQRRARENAPSVNLLDGMQPIYDWMDGDRIASDLPDVVSTDRDALIADAARRTATNRALLYGMEGQVTAGNLRTALGSTARGSSSEFAAAALPRNNPFGTHLTPAMRGAIGAAAYANQRGLDVGAVSALSAAGGDFNFRGLTDVAMLPTRAGFSGSSRNAFIQSMTGAIQSAGMQGISGDLSGTMQMGLAAVNQGGNAQEILSYLRQAIGGMGQRASGVTAGASGFVEDMAYVDAMSRGGGDIFKAQDIMRAMTPEERIQIARRHSEFLTRADLRSKMSGESAEALLAGQLAPENPEDPLSASHTREKSMLSYAFEAVQRAVGDTQQGLQDVEAETTVKSEGALEKAANTMDAAASTFSHAVSNFGAAVINLFG